MRVAGFGFRKGAAPASLHSALDVAVSGQGVTHVATVSEKAASEVFQAFASRTGLPVIAVDADALGDVEVLTVSKKSLRLWGTGSLSEAVALLAAGPEAVLTGPRVVSPDSMATCAIAIGGHT